MEQTIQLFTKESNFKELTDKAKEFGINYVGIKKAKLAELVNERLTAAQKIENKGEKNMKTVVENKEVNENNEETKEVKQSGKWFEVEGAFPYKEGEVVEILDMPKHKGLIGRKAQVVKPSAKRNALKAHLLHPVTGEPQKSLITLDFDKITLDGANQVEETTEEKVQEVM